MGDQITSGLGNQQDLCGLTFIGKANEKEEEGGGGGWSDITQRRRRPGKRTRRGTRKPRPPNATNSSENKESSAPSTMAEIITQENVTKVVSEVNDQDVPVDDAVVQTQELPAEDLPVKEQDASIGNGNPDVINDVHEEQPVESNDCMVEEHNKEAPELILLDDEDMNAAAAIADSAADFTTDVAVSGEMKLNEEGHNPHSKGPPRVQHVQGMKSIREAKEDAWAKLPIPSRYKVNKPGINTPQFWCQKCNVRGPAPTMFFHLRSKRHTAVTNGIDKHLINIPYKNAVPFVNTAKREMRAKHKQNKASGREEGDSNTPKTADKQSALPEKGKAGEGKVKEGKEVDELSLQKERANKELDVLYNCKTPCVGVQHLVEFSEFVKRVNGEIVKETKLQFLCDICVKQLNDPRRLMEHVQTMNHKLNYLKFRYPAMAEFLEKVERRDMNRELEKMCYEVQKIEGGTKHVHVCKKPFNRHIHFDGRITVKPLFGRPEVIKKAVLRSQKASRVNQERRQMSRTERAREQRFPGLFQKDLVNLPTYRELGGDRSFPRNSGRSDDMPSPWKAGDMPPHLKAGDMPPPWKEGDMPPPWKAEERSSAWGPDVGAAVSYGSLMHRQPQYQQGFKPLMPQLVTPRPPLQEHEMQEEARRMARMEAESILRQHASPPRIENGSYEQLLRQIQGSIGVGENRANNKRGMDLALFEDHSSAKRNRSEEEADMAVCKGKAMDVVDLEDRNVDSLERESVMGTFLGILKKTRIRNEMDANLATQIISILSQSLVQFRSSQETVTREGVGSLDTQALIKQNQDLMRLLDARSSNN